MASCDICGRPAFGRAIVEGAEMAVCPPCSSYGRVLNSPQQRQPQLPPSQREVALVPGFGQVISKAREAQELTRAQLGAKLNISERDVENFESERIKPTDRNAEKLGNYLKVKLIVEASGQVAPLPLVKRGGFTITLADVVKIKHAKKK